MSSGSSKLLVTPVVGTPRLLLSSSVLLVFCMNVNNNKHTCTQINLFFLNVRRDGKKVSLPSVSLASELMMLRRTKYDTEVHRSITKQALKHRTKFESSRPRNFNLHILYRIADFYFGRFIHVYNCKHFYSPRLFPHPSLLLKSCSTFLITSCPIFKCFL